MTDDKTPEYSDTIWSGRCADCGAVMFFGSDDQTDNERRAEIATTWPEEYPDGGFTSCFACDGSVDWNGSDDAASVLLREAVYSGKYAPVLRVERSAEPSEAAVEAAARALDANYNPDRYPVMAAMFEDYARTALTAVARAVRGT